ncbi:hypothetical protein BDV98DRAFT_644607 [Pterulicium gracile]|uniref:Uncharacterized protein n=1 Tax=Pterulicium gracile TaxID=1884261 RepID=A0A5C3Q2L0_9AGAR|nr:hypothetical protein BDV98DRAFT_644607 [Pterula gracilis]
MSCQTGKPSAQAPQRRSGAGSTVLLTLGDKCKPGSTTCVFEHMFSCPGFSEEVKAMTREGLWQNGVPIVGAVRILTRLQRGGKGQHSFTPGCRLKKLGSVGRREPGKERCSDSEVWSKDLYTLSRTFRVPRSMNIPAMNKYIRLDETSAGVPAGPLLSSVVYQLPTQLRLHRTRTRRYLAATFTPLQGRVTALRKLGLSDSARLRVSAATNDRGESAQCRVEMRGDAITDG